MSWLRVKLGAWLLGPLLRAEIKLAYHKVEQVPEKAEYWMGRYTGASRIYTALVTRSEHLDISAAQSQQQAS